MPSTFCAMCRDTAESTRSTVAFNTVDGAATALFIRNHPNPDRASYWMYVQEQGGWGELLEQWKDGYKQQIKEYGV